MNFRQPVIYIKQVLERSTLTLGTRKAGKADLSLTEQSEFLKSLEGYDLLSEATDSGLITACWILKLALLLRMQMRWLDLWSWGRPMNLGVFRWSHFRDVLQLGGSDCSGVHVLSRKWYFQSLWDVVFVRPASSLEHCVSRINQLERIQKNSNDNNHGSIKKGTPEEMIP